MLTTSAQEIKERIKDRCKNFPEGVDAVMELSRALWMLAFARDLVSTRGRNYKLINEERLLESEQLSQSAKELCPLFLDYLQAKPGNLCVKKYAGILSVYQSLFNPVRLAREILGEDLRPDNELLYYVGKNIRRHYACDLSVDTAYLFNLLADAVDLYRSTTEKIQPPAYVIGFKNKNPVGLLIKLQEGADQVSQHLNTLFEPDVRQRLLEFDRSKAPSEELLIDLLEELHRLLRSETLLKINPDLMKLLKAESGGDNLIHLNRHLLMSAYPNDLNDRKKPKQKTASRKQSHTEKTLQDATSNGQDSQSWNYPKGLQPFLVNLLKGDAKFWRIKESESTERESKLTQEQFDEICHRAVDLFVECCRAVNYIRVKGTSGSISIETAEIDAEYLLTNLFGMPTGIEGFDDLFGGGGIRLTEHLSAANSNKLKGRNLLVKGRFGTGKSLLALQLAVEVARKGGLAWVVALEQTAEECLYLLESMRALPNDGSINVFKGSWSIEEIETFLEKQKDKNQGILMITSTEKGSFDVFRNEFVDLAEFINLSPIMGSYSLRLLCVDPLNSITADEKDVVKLRATMHDMIKNIAKKGTNILLVAEDESESPNEFPFEQNIADTVIHLSVKERHGYAQRYLEIRKSRLQREQRGRHPFSIVSGNGIRVYLSTASVSSRLRSRTLRGHRWPTRFGLPAFDEHILPNDEIDVGDIIVFQGEGGSFKTRLGLCFLLGLETQYSGPQVKPERIYSLLVTVRYDEMTVRHMLKQVYESEFRPNDSYDKESEHEKKTDKPSKKPDQIIVSSMPKGFVNPSYILQQIENEFFEVEKKGGFIDRVMIDNVTHWEMSCPFVQDDLTFADTLVDLLRRRGVTSLLICGEIRPDQTSIIQHPIIDNADCLIRFDKGEFEGLYYIKMRVLKTRGMKHRQESFEITLTDNRLAIRRSSSQLQGKVDGESLQSDKKRVLTKELTETQDASKLGQHIYEWWESEGYFTPEKLSELGLIEPDGPHFGADALRYALVTSSMPELEADPDLTKIEGAKRFCNKIWHATQFVLNNVKETPPPLQDLPADVLHLPDRWILSRLNRLTEHVTELFNNYQYGEAGRQIYSFFWSEFCDWYIEFSKLRLYRDDTSRMTPLAVLLHVVETSLRLLHPFMPDTTESLWQSLPDSSKSDPASIIAKWPEANRNLINDAAEDQFDIVKQLVSEVRKLRAENDIKPGQLIAAQIAAGDNLSMVESLRDEIVRLCKLDPAAVVIGGSLEAPDNSTKVVVGSLEAYIPKEVWLSSQTERLSKELKQAEEEIIKLENRLTEYLSQETPKKVVQHAENKLGKLTAKRDQIKERLAQLGK